MAPTRRELTFLGILRALNRARVRYLVAGGMAVSLHGVPRMTHDLDLYMDLQRANLLRAVRSFRRQGLMPSIPEPPEAIADPRNRLRWRRTQNMKVLKFMNPGDPFHPVDVFVAHRIPFSSAWKRRRIVDSEGVPIPILSIRDLIALKRVAHREQDLSDILMLRAYERDSKNH